MKKKILDILTLIFVVAFAVVMFVSLFEKYEDKYAKVLSKKLVESKSTQFDILVDFYNNNSDITSIREIYHTTQCRSEKKIYLERDTVYTELGSDKIVRTETIILDFSNDYLSVDIDGNIREITDIDVVNSIKTIFLPEDVKYLYFMYASDGSSKEHCAVRVEGNKEIEIYSYNYEHLFPATNRKDQKYSKVYDALLGTEYEPLSVSFGTTEEDRDYEFKIWTNDDNFVFFKLFEVIHCEEYSNYYFEKDLDYEMTTTIIFK